MKLTGNGWLRRTVDRMKQRRVVAVLIAMVLLGTTPAATAGAQAVSTTTVQGTVYLANGQAGSGTLHLSWPAFTTANGQAVAADSMNVAIGMDGFVSVNLAPNLGATPAGLYYTAVFYMNDGTTSTQYWVVPSAAQASLAQVQSQLMPAAQAVQAVSKAYVDQSISELSQSLLTASGGTLSGPLYLSGDPSQALQAADKHYVDTAVSTAVPLTGGSMTGALSTPAVNGVQAPAANSAQTTLQAAMTAAGTNGAMEIPPTYTGVDGFTNPNGVRVTDLRTGGAQPTERSVKEFGAVCDGVTDDTSALQSALNYAQAHGVALTIPQGTCKTRTLSWHGESIGGMGKQVSALMGFPGQDVLASQTDTPNFLQNTRLHDLTIYVDQSMDVSCSPAKGRAGAGSCTISRPLENNSIFSPGGNGLTGTVGTGAGWAVGNCAIAMPAVTGTGGNGLKVAEIENVAIATTGVDPLASQYPGIHSTHTCGMYLAQWPQWSEFRNIDLRGLNTGIAVPALPGTPPAGLNADSNRWQNITIQATHGFTAAAGSNNSLDTIVAMAGNSPAGGEAPTGLVLDLAGGQQGWTVRNAVVMPTWNVVQPQLTVTTASGAVTGVSVGSEHGLGFDPYGTQVPLQFSGSCTAAATANVNSDGSVGTISVTQGGTGCSGTTAASVNVAGTWDTAAPVNLIGGQNMGLFSGNLLKGNGGYTVWNATGSESYGTQLSGGGGKLPGGGTYAALVSNNGGTGGVTIGSGGPNAASAATIDNAGNAQFNGTLQVAGTASFTGATSIQFPGLSAGSGHNCLQIDPSGYVSNTGSACGSGSGSGTVNSGSAGQIAYYTGNGATVAGMNMVPLASGGTGAATAAGALQNLGGISSTTTSQQTMAGPLNAIVNGEIAVTVFGAKGDCTGSGPAAGCTDNHDAIQAAIDAAYVSGGSVYFPSNPSASGQTVYYTSSAINPKGVSMFGPPGASGPGNFFLNTLLVAVRGAPGKDVFALTDASDTGYVQPRASFAVRDLAIIVDGSVDASASFPYRRPGKICDDVSMDGSTGIATSAAQCLFAPGDVGQSVTVAGAGAAGAALSTTIASWQSATQVTLAASSSTSVTNANTYISVMGLPATQNIGNCGFAYPDRAGAASIYSGPFKSDFSNVVIESTTSYVNNTCGFFFQGNQAPTWTRWQNVTVSAGWGFAYVPENQSTPTQDEWAGSTDFNTWQNIFIGAHYPFLLYAASRDTISAMQIGGAYAGPQILANYSTGSTPGFWKIDIRELEPDTSCPYANSVLRVAGWDFTIDRFKGSLCSTHPGTFQWDANSSTVEDLRTAWITNFNVTGDNNRFYYPVDADDLNSVTFGITGRGNTLKVGTDANPFDGIQPARARFAARGSTGFGPPELSRSGVVYDRTHDFLNKGASAYYFNDEDLWLWPKEIGGPYGTGPSLISDSTSATGSAFLVPSGGVTQYYSEANGTNFYVGSQIPAGKMRVYISAKAASSTNLRAEGDVYYSSAWHSIGSFTFSSLTPGYSVYSFDIDATGYAGDQFRIDLGGASTPTVDTYVGWVGMRPWTSDLPTGSLQVGNGAAISGNHGTGTSLQHSDGTGTSGVCFFAADGSCTAAAGALQNGTAATTQSGGDNSTKVATTAYVDGKTAFGAISLLPQPVDCHTACSPTAAQLSNALVSNYGQGAATVTITGPTPAAGMHFIMTVGTAPGAYAWKYTSTGANIYLDGSTTAVTNILFATPGIGNSISCYSFQTGSTVYSLKCTTLSGTSTSN